MKLRLSLLVVVLLAGACSAERPTLATDGGAAREVDAPEASGETVATTPSIAADVVLRIAVDDTWQGDPADAGPASLSTRVLADLLYEGLTRLDSSGSPEPALASHWDVSLDRMQWDFVLASDLVDGSGRAVTAENVVASLEAVVARGHADQTATALASVSGIEAIDQTTVRIRLDSPFELLPEVLASPALGIVNLGDDGYRGTTGAYRTSDDGSRLVAIDEESAVNAVELVRDADDIAADLSNGLIDWAVVEPGVAVDGLPGDVLRQPLDIRVVMAFRLPDRAERLGLSLLLDPVSIVSGIPGVSAVSALPVGGVTALPDSVVIDIPPGLLGAVAEHAASQLEAAGVAIEWVDSSAVEFAGRVTSGEAVVFPMVVAGGTGFGGSTMRFFAPGGVDDLFGDSSEEWTRLAEAAASAIDPEIRRDDLAILEQYVASQGLVRIVGQYEATVVIGSRLVGLRQRGDGTLDLSGVGLSASG